MSKEVYKRLENKTFQENHPKKLKEKASLTELQIPKSRQKTGG